MASARGCGSISLGRAAFPDILGAVGNFLGVNAGEDTPVPLASPAQMAAGPPKGCHNLSPPPHGVT